jgi:hypothetical protein
MLNEIHYFGDDSGLCNLRRAGLCSQSQAQSESPCFQDRQDPKVTKVTKATKVTRVARTKASAKVAARSSATRTPARTYAPVSANIGGVKEVEKPIQVTGQSRNLSMLLTLKNEKDKVKFVEVRRSYRDQVPYTRF